MKKLFLSSLLTFCPFLPFTLYCQDGTPDATFSDDGKVITDIRLDDKAYAIAVQADGKILVAGTNHQYEGSADFVMVRYNIDGTLDNSFGSGGTVITDFGSDEVANSIAVQHDRKIILAGFTLAQGYAFAVARYNSDGSLDNTFSTDGKVTTNIGNFGDIAFSVGLQSDDKIVVAGNSEGLSYDFALVRYNSDGSLDNTFGTSGIVTTDFGMSENESGRSLAIQNDGKIVVAGMSDNGVNIDFAIARYNSDGTLDNSFSSDGRIISDFMNENDEIYAVTIQSDGKIVAAGRTYNNNPRWIFALARYNTDGALDTTFGSDGKISTAIAGNDAARGVAIQTDGKIVAAGYSDNDFVLVRYNIDGSLDNTFDDDGMVITDFGSTDEGYALALQGDSKILVAGSSQDDFAVARYNNPGTAGIVENEPFRLEIGPNPSGDAIEVNCVNGKLESVVVYGIDGTKLFQDAEGTRSSKSISLLTFSPGIYILECITTSGREKVKIVKQ